MINRRVWNAWHHSRSLFGKWWPRGQSQYISHRQQFLLLLLRDFIQIAFVASHELFYRRFEGAPIVLAQQTLLFLSLNSLESLAAHVAERHSALLAEPVDHLAQLSSPLLRTWTELRCSHYINPANIGSARH